VRKVAGLVLKKGGAHDRCRVENAKDGVMELGTDTDEVFEKPPRHVHEI
jgi:hypothetical protein